MGGKRASAVRRIVKAALGNAKGHGEENPESSEQQRGDLLW